MLRKCVVHRRNGIPNDHTSNFQQYFSNPHRSSSPKLDLTYLTMKKFFSLLAIASIIAISNCTSIPENNDPILGIWVKNDANANSNKSGNSTREEWIFNDVYLGRYQTYTDANLTFYTDFKWSEDNGVYTITYSHEEVSDVVVSLEETNEPEILALENGTVFATRE